MTSCAAEQAAELRRVNIANEGKKALDALGQRRPASAGSRQLANTADKLRRISSVVLLPQIMGCFSVGGLKRGIEAAPPGGRPFHLPSY